MNDKIKLAAKRNILFNHRTADRILRGEELSAFGEECFKQGAQWQKDNLWTSVEEGLPEDGIENPKFGQEIKCLGYYDGDVFPCTRFYEIEGDYEDIRFAWLWDDGEPEYWMYKPEFKN